MATATNPWNTKASNGEGGNYELPPSGTHPSMCIAIIDLGTHKETFNNETKESRKLLFVWELTAEADSNGDNFVIAQDFTWSLNKKARLRAMVEGWTGTSIPDGADFDILSLLGKPCMLSIKIGQTSSGKAYASVGQVMSPMKGLTIPPATNEIFSFHLSFLASSLDELPIPAWVPYLYGKSVAEKIKASSEFQDLPPI